MAESLEHLHSNMSRKLSERECGSLETLSLICSNQSDDTWPDESPVSTISYKETINTPFKPMKKLPGISSLLHESKSEMKLPPILLDHSDSQSTCVQDTIDSTATLTEDVSQQSSYKRDSHVYPYQHPSYHQSQANHARPYYPHPYYQYYQYDPRYYYYPHPQERYNQPRPVTTPTPTPYSHPIQEPTKIKRQKKDPNAPKHPMSGFLFYLSAMRKKYAKKYPKYGVGMLSKIVAQKWKELSDGEKEPFVKQSEMDKLRYSREMELWHQKE
jgi:hypothetical protein